MVDKIKTSPYFKAGILTLFVFITGMLFGIFIDNFRLSEIKETISRIEVDSNDAILLSSYFQTIGKKACDLALDINLKFNDKIYKDGQQIERTLNANIFTPELEQEWRRYILLQTQFWFNSIELKKSCNYSYYNVVHISKIKDLSPQQKATNKLQSEIMLLLKEKCGNKIMLIPLTADSDLIVIDTIVNQYDIKQFPAIIVNEEKVFQGLTSLDELESVINC